MSYFGKRNKQIVKLLQQEANPSTKGQKTLI